MLNTFKFNVSFTRADENHEEFHVVGYEARAQNSDEAEAIVRRRLGHLTVIDVELFEEYDANGEVVR